MKAKLAGVDKMIGAHPESWWKTPAFYRADGRPVFPIGGGAPDDDVDDDTDDDPDDGGDDGGSDLDDEIDDALGDDDTDDDELTPAEKKLAARLEKSLDTKLEKVGQSIADRLVNAQATAAKKAAQARARAAAAGGGRKTDDKQQPTATDHGPDIRDAKATYRELVTGEIQFASNVEREAGMKLATAVVTRAVQNGADPDDAGKQAAQEVASTIAAIRKDARKHLLLQLKKEGRLVPKEKSEGGGAGTGGGIGSQATRVATGASAKTDMQKGADAAARIRPRATTNK